MLLRLQKNFIHLCVCRENDDLVGLKEWSRIADAPVCLGIDTTINNLRMAQEEEKKLEEEAQLKAAEINSISEKKSSPCK